MEAMRRTMPGRRQGVMQDGLTLAGLMALLLQTWEKQLQRRALVELDDRLLRDMGISRDDARLEAAKRFWE